MAVPVGQRRVPDTPATKSLYACDKALEMAAHTMHICANPKIFLQEYEGLLTQRIVSAAVGIYANIWQANNIRVTQPQHWERRSALQEEAAELCNVMLALVGLAKRVFHLRMNKFNYWTKLVLETRGLIRAWHESDAKRYAAILAGAGK